MRVPFAWLRRVLFRKDNSSAKLRQEFHIYSSQERQGVGLL